MTITRSHIVLVLACFGFSFILIFSTILKNAGVSSFQQVLFRIVLALPLILALIRGRVRFKRKDLPYFAVTGFVFSAFLLSALSSIVFGCPVAVTVALIYTQPLFTAVLSIMTGREDMNMKKFSMIFVGIAGAFLASGLATEPISSLSVPGLLLALFAGFLYAVYLYMKRMLKADYAPLQGLFNTFLLAIPCTLLLGFVLRIFTSNPSFVGFSILNVKQLLLLLLFALFSTAMPYGLLNYVKPCEVSSVTEGMMLLLDPVLHNIWAITILRQCISITRYIGVGLILLSAAAMIKQM